MFQDKDVDEWLEELKSENSNQRKMAALALGEIEPSSSKYSVVMNRLIDIINNDPDDGVLVNSAVSLIKLGAPKKAIKPLIDHKKKILASGSETEKLDSITSLKKIGSSGQLGKELTMELMMDALTDDQWMIRWNAIAFLSQLLDETAIKPLIIALDDENVDVQTNAARGLRDLIASKRPEEIPENERKLIVKSLIRILENGEYDWTIKCFSIQALGNIRDALGVDRIVDSLSNSNENVRMYASHTLGNLKLKKAIKPLLKIYQDDPHANVRKNAEEALTTIFESVSDEDTEKKAFFKLKKMFK